jgi:hypothetical protein
MKELTSSNFPGIDLGDDIQSVTYIGFPMPNEENYADLSIYGSVLNVSVDDFIANIEDYNLGYSTCDCGCEDGCTWKLEAYAKYAAQGNNPDKDVVFLYYKFIG